MEQLPIETNPNETPKILPGPWAWYVLLVAGIALTGFFPWLMVSWALYQRGKRGTAALAAIINLILFLVCGWIWLTIPVAWQWVALSTYLLNAIWGLTAWVFQQKIIGSAARRYLLVEWKTWITPVLIGAILGLCIAMVFATFPAMQNRVAIWGNQDSLDRETILWDFFGYSFLGLGYGVALGFWWAGERQRFRASHVITFLTAFSLTVSFWLLFGFLLIFLVHQGTLSETATYAGADWAVAPPWISGFPHYLLVIQRFDVLSFLAVALLFGAASRIRDFGKWLLLIPLAFVCLLPRVFSEKEWWQGTQDQIFYNMSAPDPQTRASAYKWAEILLQRYPEHLQWPDIAEEIARYAYQQGQYERARTWYQQINDRYSNQHQWYWIVGRVRAALSNPEFGKPVSNQQITIPLVDYEDYLTPNWMTLLAIIRYWEGPNKPESEIKIKLKDLSVSDDQIRLNPLTNLADLADAARSLGYDILILPVDLNRGKALIAAGIPIIHPMYTTFNLLFGVDESRSAIRAYAFERLSYRVREEARKETQEILAITEEGHGGSQERLTRIAHEAYGEYATDFWNSPSLRYLGPFMAIVFPAEKIELIAQVLNVVPDQFKKQHKGYMAALIGLAYCNHADPIEAIEWAKVGAANTDDPLPLYVAYLAQKLWETRNQKVTSQIRLQDQFPELANIFTYFEHADNQAFLERAHVRFEADREVATIPWIILNRYAEMLDQSDSGELSLIIRLSQQGLGLNPSDTNAWSRLADTYEWADNLPGMVDALQGQISADPTDSKAKLRLAYGQVVLGRYAEAKATLKLLDASQIHYDADYPFCLAAIAESEGKLKDALEQYEAAIDMRRYKPIYFLKYGKLLQQTGETEKARKALAWAARIDAKGAIKQDAESLLSKM